MNRTNPETVTSYWIGIFWHVAYEQTITLAIHWDSVWLPDNIKESTDIVKDWPYLFIQLTHVSQISTHNYVELSGTCRTIARHEFDEIDGNIFLTIDDVYGGQINITYRGKTFFLAMDPDGSVLPI